MALKCPECGTTAHARTSAYEAPSVKRSWYQCQNLECSCTFYSAGECGYDNYEAPAQ